MTVDATGNVGIGTTSPTSKLHLAGSVADLNIQYTGTAGNNEQKVNFIWTFVGRLMLSLATALFG